MSNSKERQNAFKAAEKYSKRDPEITFPGFQSKLRQAFIEGAGYGSAAMYRNRVYPTKVRLEFLLDCIDRAMAAHKPSCLGPPLCINCPQPFGDVAKKIREMK